MYLPGESGSKSVALNTTFIFALCDKHETVWNNLTPYDAETK